MPEEVTINKDLKIIEVRSYGDVTKGDLRASVETIKVIAKETGFNRVLVDTREHVSMPSILALDSFVPVIPASIKVAVVATEEQATARDLEFISSVASVEGRTMEIFPSREDALEWLNS